MTAKAPSIPVFHTARRVTDGHMTVFDGTSGWLIKDGGAVPSVPASALQAVRVELNDAQTRALPTTGFLSLVTGEANKIIIPKNFFVFFDWVADLTNIQDDDFGYGWPPVTAWDGRVATNAIFHKARSAFKNIEPTPGGDFLDTSLDGTAQGLRIGQDFGVFFTNGSLGDFTGGDPANRFVIDLVYRVVTL
jgi:hypothetical protein